MMYEHYRNLWQYVGHREFGHHGKHEDTRNLATELLPLDACLGREPFPTGSHAFHSVSDVAVKGHVISSHNLASAREVASLESCQIMRKGIFFKEIVHLDFSWGKWIERSNSHNDYAPLVLYLLSKLSLILWPMFPNWSLILVPNGVCSYSSLDLILRSYGCTSIIFLFYPIVYSLLRVSELIPHWRIEPFIIDSTYNIVFDHIDYWFLILRSELYSACQMSIVYTC